VLERADGDRHARVHCEEIVLSVVACIYVIHILILISKFFV
jgi:hypothetical protein